MTPNIPKSATSTQVVVDKASFDRVMLNIRVLPRRVGIKVFRIALNAWGGVVRDAAKAFAPAETGLLKKSLRVKVVIPDASFDVKHHGKPAYVLVGPGRRTGRMIRFKTKRVRHFTRAVNIGDFTRAADYQAALRQQRAGIFKRSRRGRGFGEAQQALEAERGRRQFLKLGKPFDRERAAVAAVLQKFAGKGVTFRSPTRYAHLVEKGTKRGVKATRFIERAARVGEGAGFNKFADKMRDGLAAEASKLASK